MNLTLPEKLLADLQQEAERSNRSVSEVVATTIEEAWQSEETKLTSLQQQLTQLADKVELEFATIQQLLSKLIELQEGQRAPKPERHTEETERPKIATYEQMYGPITRTPPPEPPPAPVPRPRRRWPWSS